MKAEDMTKDKSKAGPTKIKIYLHGAFSWEKCHVAKLKDDREAGENVCDINDYIFFNM